MKIVCIDTQILSFGLVKIPPSGNEHLVYLATDFLKWVEQQNFTVILPTIVVSELLIAVPVEKHASVLKLLQRDWRIVQFERFA
jgi:hypothetical protein